MGNETKARCAYCLRNVPYHATGATVPVKDWGEAAKHHATNCEWIATKGRAL